jgi:hypothetical protein
MPGEWTVPHASSALLSYWNKHTIVFSGTIRHAKIISPVWRGPNDHMKKLFGLFTGALESLSWHHRKPPELADVAT